MSHLIKISLSLVFYFCSFAHTTTLEGFSFWNKASKGKSRPTICVNMIVKNESKVIERCLNSMLPIIDYWVIVDTGSTDGTQNVIKNFMKKKGVPGVLHERPWKNFAHNRNEAITLAKGKADYLFFIDADEYLSYDSGFTLPKLDKDFYYVTIDLSGTRYDRIQLVHNHKDWKYIGVLHEVLHAAPSWTSSTMGKVIITSTSDGARAKDATTYQKDAQILENALKEDPDNTRYVFYLAQSYRDSGNLKEALKNYKKRVQMGGWKEEVFISLLEIGILQDALEMPSGVVVKSLTRAFDCCPSRIEPLYYLTRHFLKNEEFESSYHTAKLGLSLAPQSHVLFFQQWMHDYGLLLEFSLCTYWMGKYEESKAACEDLLKKDLPRNIRECAERNLEFANRRLLEQISRPGQKLAKSAR